MEIKEKKIGKRKLVKVSIEEKIHILANIIVDRIIEEQQNGTLNIYSNQKKE